MEEETKDARSGQCICPKCGHGVQIENICRDISINCPYCGNIPTEEFGYDEEDVVPGFAGWGN